jgi:hypothetical protein
MDHFVKNCWQFNYYSELQYLIAGMHSEIKEADSNQYLSLIKLLIFHLSNDSL